MNIGNKQELTPEQPELNDPGLQDPRLDSAIAALMANITLTTTENEVEGAGVAGPVMDAVQQFNELQEIYPLSKYLQYALAAALQVAAQGKSAYEVLATCVTSHPRFWLAKATRQQKALISWNLFFLPEFTPQIGAQVHPLLQQMVTGDVLLATRRGVVPRAVIFLRDDDDVLDMASLVIDDFEFTTTISPVTNPQVVAINGRILDDPREPYQIEILQCPFRPFGAQARFPYELFVRQATFDVVVLHGDTVKYFRTITPSARMKAAHARLAQMFETTAGPKLTTNDINTAIKRHQDLCDLKSIVY